jgi:hypothetical protein
MATKSTKGSNKGKLFADKRTANPRGKKPNSRKGGAPFQEMDPKRRLGNYGTTGEPHRTP